MVVIQTKTCSARLILPNMFNQRAQSSTEQGIKSATTMYFNTARMNTGAVHQFEGQEGRGREGNEASQHKNRLFALLFL
jgi:hypothetical protein